MGNPRNRPDLVQDTARQVAIELGQALEAVIDSPPWKTLVSLLDSFVSEVGRFGLRDKNNPPMYWAGYQDGIEYVRNGLAGFVDRARAEMAAMEAEEEGGNILMGHFMGRTSGDVSGGEVR